MQYIDASMVGELGAHASASIGLVLTSIRLFRGICTTVAVGFSVPVEYQIGAKDRKGTRTISRQSIVASLLFSLAVYRT